MNPGTLAGFLSVRVEAARAQSPTCTHAGQRRRCEPCHTKQCMAIARAWRTGMRHQHALPESPGIQLVTMKALWRPRLEKIACRFGVLGVAARGLPDPTTLQQMFRRKHFRVLIRHERAFSRYSPSSPSTAGGPRADSADTGPGAPPTTRQLAHVTARLRKLPSCTAVMNAAMRRNARSGGSFGRAWWQHFRRESIRNAYKCCGATRRALRCSPLQQLALQFARCTLHYSRCGHT